MRANPYIEQAAMADLNGELITAVNVVKKIKQVCCVAGVVIGVVARFVVW